MANLRLLLIAGSLVLLLSSCAEQLVTFSDQDSSVNLQQYKTYAWIAPGDSTLNPKRKDKLFGGFVTYKSDEELKKKGMTVNTESPDALFMFESQVEEKIQYTPGSSVSVGVGYGGPGYYVGGTVPVAVGEIKASTFEDGTLIMNMYDRKTGKLVWTGGAKKTFSNQDDVEDVISAAVKAIFTRLPIKK